MKNIILALTFGVVLVAGAGYAKAQVIYVSNDYNGTVGKYNATTGAAINAAFVTGLDYPVGIAVSGNDLFVVNRRANTIGKYNATTGATINASLVSGLSTPIGVVVSGNNLYVANNWSANGSSIGKYDATTGATINNNFIPWGGGSGLNWPGYMAISGNSLFVANEVTIGEYDATTGASLNVPFALNSEHPNGLAVSENNLFAINATGSIFKYNILTGTKINTFFTGLNGPQDIDVLGNTLYVSKGNKISQYDATTGVLINDSFITASPPQTLLSGIAVVPEPSTYALFGLGALALIVAYRRKIA